MNYDVTVTPTVTPVTSEVRPCGPYCVRSRHWPGLNPIDRNLERTLYAHRDDSTDRYHEIDGSRERALNVAGSNHAVIRVAPARRKIPNVQFTR